MDFDGVAAFAGALPPLRIPSLKRIVFNANLAQHLENIKDPSGGLYIYICIIYIQLYNSTNGLCLRGRWLQRQLGFSGGGGVPTVAVYTYGRDSGCCKKKPDMVLEEWEEKSLFQTWVDWLGNNGFPVPDDGMVDPDQFWSITDAMGCDITLVLGQDPAHPCRILIGAPKGIEVRHF